VANTFDLSTLASCFLRGARQFEGEPDDSLDHLFAVAHRVDGMRPVTVSTGVRLAEIDAPGKLAYDHRSVPETISFLHR